MSEHYFSDTAPAREDELRLLKVKTRGRELKMWVSSRVFSASRLDLGTAQLLKTMPDFPQAKRIMDLGCGWGPVAITAGLDNPQAQIWAVDINPRALALTVRNAEANSVKNVKASLAPNALQKAREEGILFDAILSNPPVRIGKTELHKMLTDWLSLLSPGGEVWLVMGKNLGGDSLIKWLTDIGFPAEKVVSKKGYRIIRATPVNPVPPKLAQTVEPLIPPTAS